MLHDGGNQEEDVGVVGYRRIYVEKGIANLNQLARIGHGSFLSYLIHDSCFLIAPKS